MDTFPLILAGTSAATAAFSVFAAYKAFGGMNKFKLPESIINAIEKEKKGQKRRGTTKITNILSVFPNGIARTRDGGYVRGYNFKPSESFYSSDGEIRRLYDRFALLITGGLPKDCVIQIRFDNLEDKGNLLNEQILEMSQHAAECDETAQLLKQEELDYYFDLAGAGNFRHGNFDVWVYVPATRGNGQIKNGFDGIISAVCRADLTAAREAYFTGEKQIVTRFVAEEEKSYEIAARHFRNFEQNFPLEIKPLLFEETCVKLRISHNPGMKSIPLPPASIDTDWQSYISRTSIQSVGSWYLWHGSTPVTVVTLFEPPESSVENPTCYPGLMRFFTTNPTLKGRVSVISEFICYDKDESITALKKELKKMRETNTRPSGNVEFKDDKTKRTYQEKKQMLTELTSPGKALTALRFHIIVRGEEVRYKEEKKAALKELEERASDVIRLIHENMQGAQADLEDPVALRDIYEKCLVGELTPASSMREIREQALSLACFIPAEADWKGIEKEAHNFFVNTSGEIVGVNLLRNPYAATPLTLILGSSGSGKSVLAADLISGFLASIPGARVRACDYGGSLAPLVNLFDGRYFRFSDKDRRTINVWDYDGLESREPPDDEQVELVVKDTLILLAIDEGSETGRDFAAILEKCVRHVYNDEVPRNAPGRRHEPRLSHLIRKLRTFPFDSATDKAFGSRMASRLENFENNPWVDAPTHESFRHESRFDVYELSSLDKLPESLRSCLAFRIGTRVGTGDEEIEGKNPPTLVVFDEVHELVGNDYLHHTLRGAEKTTRHGRKKNKVPILITHSFDDIKAYPGFTSNIGTIFVGKQDDIGSLKALRKWNDTVSNTIYNIDNHKGLAHQFLFATGQGDHQKITTIQVYLSPISLWTFTTDPPEDEARKIVANALPHWRWRDVLVWLARTYPRGLSAAGKREIDEADLTALITAEQHNNPQYRHYVRQMQRLGQNLHILPEDIDFEELADEAVDMLDEEIDKIKRDNFMNLDTPGLADFGIDIPGAFIVGVQGE